jgi:hypothetical protein
MRVMWSEPTSAEIYFVGAVLVWALAVIVALLTWPSDTAHRDVVRDMHADWFGTDGGQPDAHAYAARDLPRDRARVDVAARTGPPVSQVSGLSDRVAGVATPVAEQRP